MQTTFYILINNISNTYFIINGHLFNNNHKGHKHKSNNANIHMIYKKLCKFCIKFSNIKLLLKVYM